MRVRVTEVRLWRPIADGPGVLLAAERVETVVSKGLRSKHIHTNSSSESQIRVRRERRRGSKQTEIVDW